MATDTTVAWRNTIDIQNEIAQQALGSARTYGLVNGGDLLMVPEAISPLSQMAEQITGGLVVFHERIGKQLQLPILQKAYCYIFAKGLEAAYVWNESADGKFDLGINFEDLYLGRVGAQVSPSFQSEINRLIPIAQDSFPPIKDWMLANLDVITSVEDGVVLCIKYSLEQSALVGLHCGLKALGY